jgi:hypothetical protein
MRMPKFMLLTVAVCLPLLAQTPDLSGTWVADTNGSEKWVLDQKSGKIHIQELSGDRVDAEFTCSLDGQECPTKENGHKEKVMMYFNGDKLVEIRERGGTSFKERLQISADGKTLKVESVPLSSDQKSETTSFHRQT